MSWVSRWNEAALNRALKGGEIDTRDDRGATPLWHAAYFGRADWVEKLLAAGADAHAPTAGGQTPYQLADHAYRQENRHDARMVLSALREAGAVPPPDPAEQPEEPAGLTEGGMVSHKKFGPGTITAVDGQGEGAKLTINFDDPAVGQKVLLARFVTPA